MKEQFVTYEIALKLKELGFDEECLCFYRTHVFPDEQGTSIGDLLGLNFLVARPEYFGFKNFNDAYYSICSAPLWQQVVDWLREKHEIFVAINYWGKRNVTPKNSVLYPNKYNYTICQELTPKEKWIEAWYGNYNEAREQAILKAIELCKKN